MNEQIKIFLLIGTGGFAGSLLRYFVTLISAQKISSTFPAGTLLVNIIGCLLIGFIFGLGEKSILGSNSKYFLATGFCGGFTTFSAFSMETLLLMKQGMFISSVVYVLASIILGLLAAFAAYSATRIF